MDFRRPKAIGICPLHFNKLILFFAQCYRPKIKKKRSIVFAVHRDARPFNASPAVCISKLAVWGSPYQDRQRYAWLAASLSYISINAVLTRKHGIWPIRHVSTHRRCIENEAACYSKTLITREFFTGALVTWNTIPRCEKHLAFLWCICFGSIRQGQKVLIHSTENQERWPLTV